MSVDADGHDRYFLGTLFFLCIIAFIFILRMVKRRRLEAERDEALEAQVPNLTQNAVQVCICTSYRINAAPLTLL